MSSVDLVVALSTARRAVQLYPPAHPSFDAAIHAVVDAVTARAGSAGAFVLNLHEGRLYDGSEVIASDSPAVAALAQTMERHRVESLTFEPSFAARDAEQVAETLNLRPGPSVDIASELASRGVSTVAVGRLGDEQDVEERRQRDERREKDRAMYRQLVGTLRAVHRDVVASGSPNLDQAEDMVGAIMSRLLEDDAAVLGLATLNATDEGSLFHGINVMIYALTLGLGLGLPEEGLMGLGIAALLHDVGKAAFDLGDPGQARDAMLLHPKIGAEVLSRLPEEDPASMLVAFEHHMGPDGSGWPERPAGYVTHPYSRMVAIANRYDNLTKAGDAGEPLTPDRAVMQVLREAGRTLDPLFARLFVRALGVFPVGCVVRLSDQSVGVVSGPGADPLTPRVKLVYDAAGMELDEPVDADLDGDARTILEVLDPAALELQVSDHL